ncbi:MAG: AMP-binding protein [Crocinitomicaceae bacterium]
MNARFRYHQLSKETQAKIADFCADWQHGKDIQINTSGSTGPPKTCSFTQQQFMVSANKTIEYFSLGADCRALLCLSPDTIGGKMMLIRSIVGNYELIISEPSLDPFEGIHESIDFVALVPAQLACILSSETSKTKLKQVKHILIGGADIHPEIVKQLKMEQIRAFQSYGMTETISHVALREIGSDPSYHALPGISFTVEADCLSIHYPELQQAVIHTNDCVQLVSPTSFIWKGRADFVVNSGGKKIHVEELEKRFSLNIDGSFILGSIPHPIWGEALILIMEKENELDKSNWMEGFEKHEIPKYFCVAPLIRTENGKIQRNLSIAQIQENEWISL